MTLPSDVNEGINQALDVADLATGNAPVKDSPLVSNGGVSGTVDGHGAGRLKATTTSGELKQRSTGSWPSQEECIRMPLASEATISASPADSHLYSLAVFLGGIDAMIQQVEGVLLRHRVTETGLAEVGQ